MPTVELVDGRAVLVRRGGAELDAEATLLAALAGDGVPEVVARREVGEGIVELMTSLDPPLSRRGTDPWRVGARLADVLARAHRLGVAHGALLPEHLRQRDGEVVLAGWASTTTDLTADVVELGRILGELAGGDRELLALVRRTAAASPPSMSSLAAALADGPLPVASRGDRRRWVVPGAGLGAAAVAVVLGLAVAPATSRATPALAPGTPAPSALRPVTTRPTTPRPPPDAIADVAVAASVHGNTVERGGSRWTIGRPGDLVVLGDWDCDGEATPAVLRPATGAVWVFERWSRDGAPTPGRQVGRHPGAASLRVRPEGRCDRLLVLAADGSASAVPPASSLGDVSR